MRPKTRIALHVLLILAIGTVIYLPAFRASFHLDDAPSIRDNAAIRHAGAAGAIWKFWPTRFFTYMTLAANFRFSGLNPAPYHVTNVLIHLLNACLVYFLFRRLLRGAGAIPLLAALLFLCHPLQTQAVTYVVQRATSLASAFYLLSLFCYLLSRTGDGRRPIPYALSLVCCIAAMLTKEFTVTLPLALALFEFTVVKGEEGKRWRKILPLLPFLLCLLLIPLLVLLHSDNLHYNDSGQIEWLKAAGVLEDVARGHGTSPLSYLLTQPRALATYLRLVFLPVGQRLEYEAPEKPSLADPAVFLPLLLILLLLTCACSWRKRTPAASLGVWLFVLLLLPESGLIPILDPIVEHRLYLPLVGAVLAYAALLASRKRDRTPLLILTGAVIVCFCALTYRRNLVWRDPVTLWEDNVKKAPGKARVRGNLGKAYLDVGRYEEAAREFRRMIDLDPTFAGAYNNLAVIYIDHLKDYGEAEKHIEASLRLFPDYPAGYVNRGVIHLNRRELRPAIENFEKALALDPKNLLAHRNLAACRVNLGDLDGAEAILRRGLSSWPRDRALTGLLMEVRRRRAGQDARPGAGGMQRGRGATAPSGEGPRRAP